MSKIKNSLVIFLALVALCLSGTTAAMAQEQQESSQTQPTTTPQQQTTPELNPQDVGSLPLAEGPLPATQTATAQIDQLVSDDEIVFTSPGFTDYIKSIRLSDNRGWLGITATNPLGSPTGAAIYLSGTGTSLPGQIYFDSGANNNAALIFRTAQTGGTITERMRVTSNGNVGIGTTNPSGAMLRVVNNGAAVDGVVGETSNPNGVGVRGRNTSTGFIGIGVSGISDAINGIGVSGSGNSVGVVGFSSSGIGVSGSSPTGLAGSFSGNVQINGRLTKSSGSFKIDHPLDPANKYLSHSFVESPDMMNIYNGNVTLDHRGRATITMPDWFEALNREFRYQLTAVGAPGPNLYVATEIKGNQFKIAGGKRGMKVSWQVTGVRQDAYAEKHRISVEEDKPAQERGTYLHPEAFGQPAEKGVTHARQPAATQQPREENRTARLQH